VGQLGDALGVAARQLTARWRAHGAEMAKGAPPDLFPQSWRFETESEYAVLRITSDGAATVATDVIESPQVLVKWSQEELVRALLEGRSNERVRRSAPTIRFTSDAGRKAFSLLGTSLGL
jgi:hypothetical protein